MKIQGTNNPDLLNGTSENDEIQALAGNDTIFGSAGNDFVDGGEGSNVLDYGNFGKPITLSNPSVSFGRPTSVWNNYAIGNKELGTSKIQNVSTIIGAKNQANTIQAGASTSWLYTIDLEKGYINLESGRGGGSLYFQNFVNVNLSDHNSFGTTKIDGNSARNYLIGSLNNDRLNGKDGKDTLTGTDGKAKGANQQDELIGGTGGDKFILGDRGGSFYKGNNDLDLVRIKDLEKGDLIQLGKGDTYNIVRHDVSFEIFVTTGGIHDAIASVEMSSNQNDILSSLPQGDFQLASGNTLGNIFIGS
jgi:Ca2+-binding RTX toxin-like protein